LKLNVHTDTANLKNLLEQDDGEDRLIEKEYRFGELESALNRLSVIDKLLISLTLEDLSMREIADIAGITESNVRVKIHRIKETLRNQLNRKSHAGE
jgi:RNA polymerase sigma-70 factor (ECF subfamily)